MAAPTPSPRSTKGPQGVIPADWPAQAADTIVETISKVRDKTTKPVLLGARGVVYGVVVLVVATIFAVLAVILLFRVLDNYVPGNIWTIYAFFAVVLSIGGLVLLRKAHAPRPEDL